MKKEIVDEKKNIKAQIFTIPNILSFVRLVMIPFIIWLYCFKQTYMWTAILLFLSGLTDVVDGFIARHFNMVSDFGKALDPIADKLTQLAVLVCLVTRFPMFLIPLVLLTVKEFVSGVLCLVVMRRTKKVESAHWHGKLNTVLLYAVMTLHIIWYSIPFAVSNICILAVVGMMIVSFVLYSIGNIKTIKSSPKTSKQK